MNPETPQQPVTPPVNPTEPTPAPVQQMSPPVTPTPMPDSTSTPLPPAKKSKKMLIIVVLVVLLVVAAGGYVVWAKFIKKAPAPVTTTASSSSSDSSSSTTADYALNVPAGFVADPTIENKLNSGLEDSSAHYTAYSNTATGSLLVVYERNRNQPSVTPKVEIDNEVSVYYKDREKGAKLVKTSDITPGGTSKGGYLIKFSDGNGGDTTVFGSANTNKLVMVILTTPTANRDKVAATDAALIASLAQN